MNPWQVLEQLKHEPLDLTQFSQPLLMDIANSLWSVTGGVEVTNGAEEERRSEAMHYIGDLCSCEEVRDYLLGLGLVNRLQAQFSAELNAQVMEGYYADALIRVIGGIFEKGQFENYASVVEMVLPVLCRYMNEKYDDELGVSRVAVAISHMSRLGDSVRARIIDCGLFVNVMGHLSSTDPSLVDDVLLFALRFMSSGNGPNLMISTSPGLLGAIVQLAGSHGDTGKRADRVILLLCKAVENATDPDLALTIARCPEFSALWNSGRSFGKMWLLKEITARLNFGQLSAHVVYESFVHCVFFEVSRSDPNRAVRNALNIVRDVLGAAQRVGDTTWSHLFTEAGLLQRLRALSWTQFDAFQDAQLAAAIGLRFFGIEV